jgi:hypothetical protein
MFHLDIQLPSLFISQYPTAKKWNMMINKTNTSVFSFCRRTYLSLHPHDILSPNSLPPQQFQPIILLQCSLHERRLTWHKSNIKYDWIQWQNKVCFITLISRNGTWITWHIRYGNAICVKFSNKKQKAISSKVCHPFLHIVNVSQTRKKMLSTNFFNQYAWTVHQSSNSMHLYLTDMPSAISDCLNRQRLMHMYILTPSDIINVCSHTCELTNFWLDSYPACQNYLWQYPPKCIQKLTYHNQQCTGGCGVSCKKRKLKKDAQIKIPCIQK